ncbi:MAG: hypothetical protein NTV22_17305 [bacterium]|nr:hypothetical protein [bacterium]
MDYFGTTSPQSDWDRLRTRMETGNATVRSNYSNELSNSMYVHAGSNMPGWFVPEPAMSSVVFLAATCVLRKVRFSQVA